MHIQVPIPWNGVSDNFAFSAQPPSTSSDLLNVRPYDPITRRRRLSQREGNALFNASRLSANQVLFLEQLTYDGRRNLYAASAGSTDLSIATARSLESRGGCFDRQGNFYFLDGTSNITKINVDGNIVWTFQPPIANAAQQLCIPFVDSLDNLYVGVQSGGLQTLAKFWRFTQDKGSAVPTKQWEMMPGAYVRRILVKGDAVYLALNYQDRHGAFVVQYTGALNTGLTEQWRTPVSYPVNDLVLKPDGSVLGCSLPFATRGLDPRYPNFTRKTIDATLRDVFSTDFDRRAWRWNKAKSLQDRKSSGIRVVVNGDSVSLVEDVGGKNRTLFTSLRSGATQPVFREEGAGGNPSIYFRGERTTPSAFRDELQTQNSASVTTAYADGAQGFVPNYTGAKWCIFILFRAEENVAAMHGGFGQNKITGTPAINGSLFFNRATGAAGAATAGVGCWIETTDVAGIGLGTGGYPQQFTYTVASGNTTGLCLLTIVSDGGDVQGGEAGDGVTITHSLLRYNGQPIDRWISAAGSTTDAAYLGHSPFLAPVLSFKGEFIEAFVLRDYTNATQGLLSHPIYPHKVHAGAATNVSYVTTTAFTATEMEKAEGVIAHEYGFAHLLPLAIQAGGVHVAGSNYPHPFSLATPTSGNVWNGPPRVNTSGRSEPFLMHSPNGTAWKLDAAKGELQWVVTAGPNDGGGGIGYTIGCSNDGQIIYSVGPPIMKGAALWNGTPTGAAAADSTKVRAWKDLGGKGETGYDILLTPTGTAKAWISSINDIAVTGGVFDGGLTITGTFTGYVWTSGDFFILTGGTGVATGSYPITSGNATTIVLATDPGAANSNTTGTIVSSWATTDIKADVDDSDNWHVPSNFNTTPSAALRIYAREPNGSGAFNVGRVLLSYDDSTGCEAYCAVCPPSPSYRRGTVPPADFNRNPLNFAFTGANWTNATLTITGTFTGYEFVSGDTVVLSAGTGVTLGTYTISSGTTTTLVVTADINGAGGNIADSSIQGSIVKAASVFARCEYDWLCVAQTGALPNATAGVLKVRLVTATPVPGAARTQILIQVVNGVVAKFTTSTMASFAGPSTLATPQLSIAATYIDGCVAFNKCFLTDGQGYIYVDPINDTVLRYKALDGGKIPERYKLMCNWRGRIVIARGVDETHQWHMSAQGDPFSWNIEPVPRVSTRAVSGVNSRVGLCPDEVNALIPYTDDILIFGCDHSIWALVGDPADEGRAGGFKQVSSVTGMAFGRPWALDPEGNIYFFGSRGGVWVMRPGAEPVSMTDETIAARLASVNLSTYTVKMEWDTEYNGLRVKLCPISGTVGEEIHYFWDRQDKGWWPDSEPFATTYMLTIDGDLPGDRVLVYGCGDGYLRQSSRTAKTDDGVAIVTRFLIGPMTPQDAKGKYRFRDFRAQLSETQDGLNVSIFESQTPDDKETVRMVTKLIPGRNRGKPLSACAPFVWLQGSSSALNKRWSIESMSMEAYPAGRAHASH